jgi:hypothetical protein
MVAGDRVKLHERIARSFTKRSRKVDWAKREGSIVSIGSVNHMATVKWDDCKSTDYWPVRALVIKQPHV